MIFVVYVTIEWYGTYSGVVWRWDRVLEGLREKFM